MLKEMFTWWNNQTVGVRLWTYFSGKLVAKDEFDNRYYTNKNQSRRWVVYNGEVEASKVTPEWNNWLSLHLMIFHLKNLLVLNGNLGTRPIKQEQLMHIHLNHQALTERRLNEI